MAPSLKFLIPVRSRLLQLRGQGPSHNTGTSLLFQPGTLTGGIIKPHACPPSRSLGWFLEPLLALAPFCKKELVITLQGITTDGRDASVDTLRTSILPHLALFLESADGLELRVRPSLTFFEDGEC